MKTTCHRFCFFISLFVLAGHLEAAEPNSSLEIAILKTPQLYNSDGIAKARYELHLRNYSQETIQVESIRIKNSLGKVVKQLAGKTLFQHTDFTGVQGQDNTQKAIKSAAWAVVFIDIRFDEIIPQSIYHQINYTIGQNTTLFEIVDSPTPLNIEPSKILSSPLKSGPWVATHNADWPRGHRRVHYANHGIVRVPGRYAIDWVRVDEKGSLSDEPSDRAVDTYSYGETVLAVGDGTVVKIIDGNPERTSLSKRPLEPVGNSVVLKLSSGEYAHYGHLKPGSILVKEGQQVKQSQTLAKVGFSGSASRPQLHFALTDGPEERKSNGIPYVFDSYLSLGKLADVSLLGQQEWKKYPVPEAYKLSTPASMTVVTF